jgi:hypothetical protein
MARVRNFNDALFAVARHDDMMAFTIDQLDLLTGQRVKVKSAGKLKRVREKVEELIAAHLADQLKASQSTWLGHQIDPDRPQLMYRHRRPIPLFTADPIL